VVVADDYRCGVGKNGGLEHFARILDEPGFERADCDPSSLDTLREVAHKLVGEHCWSVVVGAIGLLAMLDFGRKTRVEIGPAKVVQWHGEFGFSVGSSAWRVCEQGVVLASSADDLTPGGDPNTGFRRIEGCRVAGVEIGDDYDLRLRLDGGLELHIFCNEVDDGGESYNISVNRKYYAVECHARVLDLRTEGLTLPGKNGHPRRRQMREDVQYGKTTTTNVHTRAKGRCCSLGAETGNIAKAARKLEIVEGSLRNWVKQADIDEGHGPEGALTTDERDELRRLRRENKRLEMERDFLKKPRPTSRRKRIGVRADLRGEGKLSGLDDVPSPRRIPKRLVRVELSGAADHQGVERRGAGEQDSRHPFCEPRDLWESPRPSSTSSRGRRSRSSTRRSAYASCWSSRPGPSALQEDH